MNWDWGVVADFMPYFWSGLLTTLQALAWGTLIAFSLGLVWAIAVRGPAFVRWPVLGFTEFIRNTPLLVQLFFLFFVLPEWGPTVPVMVAGAVGLGLHYSTYTMEVYRAGIEAVPVGQWEAAHALSMSPRRTWQSVILPQAFRRSVPALGNYVIAMLKETPLIATIGLMEMLGEARAFGTETFRFMEPYTVVGIAFVLVAYPASLLIRALERRLVTH
ncbi:ectoine/hydroxyectoine ABC transporter permease subunit EhuD [Streptomyces calidiresistens]|uniref:Ectoine/hydroxyectoine ABC transporter permease subunit EhuD n=1 Tax=Streptomyces calidiresistens TaxID=1485586 RepID=A0A7W3T2Q7_9ACTN|nr:ectoine/hydroxyectoine ABC transporter permease subunit EhuD [Streptomyces calidiresistens]MBB0229708.1 ectoine/hydroxyectoine ABC transporter permease subunit EhuD [Streptomyces calidiresistens]